ncbi:PetM family of cytochrome b6f complex subunit 7 [Bosea sp. (in: a-proteobacteria)]|uniref:PetM family of cytochrome b6f complex subunit 7 n=1 Tax=Bosea sp. (in: a-proteobacteria) TaxID=1871050 RepID=UPI001AC8C8AC|nr:PetM family of cytochrome b6f complex subunit 7 [Bosea sp. (in: a-proteobacteria)]MBN9438817.1 PetM family of cytochrome b6f complex subunit 7 [Bosea sp. (in: a-proteobacteria)]
MRFLVRILGYLLVAGGFIVLLTDGARSIANSALRFTPLGETMAALLGDRFRQLQPGIERSLHPLLWDPVLVHVLLAPTALAGLALGFLLLWLGGEPKPLIGIVTRR